MNCSVIALMAVLAAMVATPSPARSSEWLEFAGGVAAMYAVHEGGHAAAAAVTGADIGWTVGDVRTGPGRWREIGNYDRRTGTTVSGAGLAAQAMAAEAILQSDFGKDSAFMRGAMAWNVINPIQYALRYWLWHEDGDIRNMERHDSVRSANVFAMATTVIALAQGYRFMATQPWAPEWVKSERCTFAPLSADGDGLALGFTVRF